LPFLFAVRTVETLDNNGRFTLSPATDCSVPPEAIVGAAVTPATVPLGQPVWGIADLHTHPFSYLGFGGKAFWGAAFSRFGLEHALRRCDCLGHGVVPCLTGEQLDCLREALSQCTLGNLIECLPAAVIACGPLALDNLVHGPNGLLDLVGNIGSGLDPLTGHATGGYPSFEGWPGYKNINHQQMYYKWIERSYLGGLRLMVMHAVNNEAIGRKYFTGTIYPTNDMEAVDLQIAAVKELEAFIDWQSGGPGQGWFRIAYTPQQARQIISNGKMAVVLGIEVSSLFGCRNPGDCSQDYVAQQLRRYYDLGVRQLFLIHHFENGFGGPALFHPSSNVGNRVITGHWFRHVVQCPESSFDANSLRDLESVVSLWGPALLFTGELPPLYQPLADPEEGGHCDSLGLTDLGRFAIHEMIRLGMIIEVDHQSWAAISNTLEIVEANNYPVVSSHSHAHALATNMSERTHFSLNPDQMRRVRDLGGLIAPAISQSAVSNYTGAVPNDCDGSSTSFAQVYLYTVDQIQGGPYLHAVAVGTDFSGFGKHPRPRFSLSEGCSNELVNLVQVTYPFPVDNRVGTGQFDRTQAGEKVYDINTNGLAHIGLLPDFIQELKNIGLSNADLEPLFRSAEAYLQMWERIANRPQLAITFVPGPPGSPGAITLSWPLGGSGYALECTTTLSGSPVPWVTVTLPLTTNGMTVTLTLPSPAGTSFYRLRRL
jgi:microsomal dipeptidase-like Zn-dependent dipeptidase